MDNARIITNPEQTSLSLDAESPRYTVRRSNRAKHLRINAHPDTGIEVVVPKRMSLRHVKPFVQQHQVWINRQIQQLKLDQPVELPETIQLLMANENWQISYETTESTRYRLKQQANHLTITGPDQDIDTCRDKLRQWLRQQAKLHLATRLAELSEQTGLTYQRLSIRTQRTRWGSCSSAGNINLNDRLMLIPTVLADYVMLHELCHTKHLNHSVRFWRLVEHHMPDYKAHEKQLKRSRHDLPNWL